MSPTCTNLLDNSLGFWNSVGIWGVVEWESCIMFVKCILMLAIQVDWSRMKFSTWLSRIEERQTEEHSDAGRTWTVRRLQLVVVDDFTARCTTVQSAVLISHVVRPSVRLWRWWIMTTLMKSWKLIARTISPTSSLFVDRRSFTYSQGNMEKFWGENVHSTHPVKLSQVQPRVTWS